MSKKRIGQLTFIVLLSLILISVITVLAAANIVPETHLMDQSSTVPANILVPPECDSIRSAITTVVWCTGGNCNGSNANELILGTTGNDTINGRNGDDCIVGGDGDDTLYGDNDNDVLVGGPGTDTLDGGKRKKDTDICVDDSGSTTFIDCEVIQ